MKSQFLNIMKTRRSIYQLADESPLSDEEIEALLRQAIKHTPTAYNSQLTRVVLLLDMHHDTFWNFVMDAIREVNPGVDLSGSEKRIQAFKDAYGTVLFYNDTSVTEELIEELPDFRNHFPDYAQHGNAILQYAVWCLFAEAGIGASLQHYNPIVDSRVQQEWDIPKQWELIAQMPFGTPLAGGKEKSFMDPNDRMIIYNK